MSTIQRLAAKDIDQVYDMGMQEPAFGFYDEAAFWTKEQLAAWFESLDDVCIGAFEKEELLGFILVAIHAATQKAVWENMYIKPELRKTDVGEALQNEMIVRLREKEIKHIHFLVDAGRTRLHEYFERLGNEKCGDFTWFIRNIEKS